MTEGAGASCCCRAGDWSSAGAPSAHPSQSAQPADTTKLPTTRDGTAGASAGAGTDRGTAKSQLSLSHQISDGGSSGAALAANGNLDEYSFLPQTPGVEQSPDIHDGAGDADMRDSHAGGAAAAAVPPPQPLEPSAPAVAAAPSPALLHSAPGMYAPLTAYAAAAPPTALPFAAMLTGPVPAQARLESLIGTNGAVHAVAAMNGHGLVVSGSLGGVPFSGVIGSAPGMQISGSMSSVEASAAEAAAEPLPSASAKRARLMPQPRHLSRPQLPDTVEALLARLSVCVDGGPVASAGVASGGALGSTQGERAAAMWMRLDAHKRDIVQQAVRADEDRYRTEVQARDATMVRDAALRRRDEALRAAEETMTNVCPPSSFNAFYACYFVNPSGFSFGQLCQIVLVSCIHAAC